MFRRFTLPTDRWGGLNENRNPASLGINELTEALNIFRRDDVLSTRPGTVYEASGQDWDGRVATGPTCQGAFDVASDFDGTRYLIGIFDGQPKYAHDQNLDKATNSISVTSGDNLFWTFAMGRGSGTVKVYSVGGDVSTPDDFWSWDLNTGNALVDVGAAGWGGTYPGAQYIFSKWNRGFVGGMDGTGTDDNPMVVRYSALGDMDEWPAGNVFGGVSAIGGLDSEGGNFITGFGEFTDNRGDFLLVLTQRKLISYIQTGNPFQPFAKNDVIPNGCVSQRAYVSLGVDAGDAIYVSDRGIHSLRQSQRFGDRVDKFLSEKIRETFESINRTRIKYTVAAYDPSLGMVLFAFPTGSSTVNDTIMCLDVRDVDSREGITAENARWYGPWRIVPASEAAVGSQYASVLIQARERSSTNKGKPYIYMGTYNGDLVRFATTDYRDNNENSVAPYDIRISGKHEDFGVVGQDKVVGDVYLRIGPIGDYQPQFYHDFDFGTHTNPPLSIEIGGEQATWGTAIFGQDQWATGGAAAHVRRRRLYSFGHGETVRWRIQHGGGNEPVFLSAIQQEVDGVEEDIGNAQAA